jgi:hypothetical protein
MENKRKGEHMTKKQKKRAYKKNAVVQHKLSQIETMRKKATENRESEEVIARKETNMRAYYSLPA